MMGRVLRSAVPKASMRSGGVMRATGLLGAFALVPVAVLVGQAGAHAADSGQSLISFRSPSGNIGCVVFDGTVRCDIDSRTWTPPSPPPTCDTHIVSFGQGVEVDSSGLGYLVCAGDTARDPSAPVLPYGASKVVGHIRCDSSPAGMSCVNVATNHGFSISARNYSVY
jgi:hypothetical protein